MQETPSFSEILAIKDKRQLSTRAVCAKRMARIKEAISWASGTQEERLNHGIFSSGAYEVVFQKPGKEAKDDYLVNYKDGRKASNPNDMKPAILKNGLVGTGDATFTHIIQEFEYINDKSSEALELFGSLLFRNAFLLDHIDIKYGGREGTYRYRPNSEVVSYVGNLVPEVYGVPIEVFLHYLEAIAWNEDVKYHTLGYDLCSQATGGRNNLLTYVNMIPLVTGRKRPHEFAGQLLRRGVSPITQRDALELLPFLASKNDQ